MVKASAMNTFAMNASAAKAAAMTTAAIRGFCGDWLGQCHKARDGHSGNTQTACDADRFHAAYSSRSLPEWQLMRGDLGPEHTVALARR